MVKGKDRNLLLYFIDIDFGFVKHDQRLFVSEIDDECHLLSQHGHATINLCSPALNDTIGISGHGGCF